MSYTNKEVADIVEWDGLWYAIQHCVTSDLIEDEELRSMWEECSNLMDKIEEKLGL